MHADEGIVRSIKQILNDVLPRVIDAFKLPMIARCVWTIVLVLAMVAIRLSVAFPEARNTSPVI